MQRHTVCNLLDNTVVHNRTLTKKRVQVSYG